jgi:hypothetical protein
LIESDGALEELLAVSSKWSRAREVSLSFNPVPTDWKAEPLMADKTEEERIVDDKTSFADSYFPSLSSSSSSSSPLPDASDRGLLASTGTLLQPVEPNPPIFLPPLRIMPVEMSLISLFGPLIVLVIGVRSGVSKSWALGESALETLLTALPLLLWKSFPGDMVKGLISDAEDSGFG